MPKFGAAINTQRIPILGLRPEQAVVGSPPGTPVEGLFWHDTTNNVIKVYLGGSWQTLGTAGAGGPPSGAAGGDLTGSYPNPTLSTSTVQALRADVQEEGANVALDIAVLNFTGAGITATQQSLGVAKIDVPGTFPPSGAAGGDLTGSYPNPTIGVGKVTSSHIFDGTIVDTDVAAANKDGVAGTASLRTLGTGAQQAASGTDSRFTNARTPTAHATTHQPGGGDPMAVDAVAATASLRTLGTGAQQAAAGTDARLSDTRVPTDGSVTLAKHAANSVNSSHIVDDSIVLADLNSALSGPAANVFGLRKLIGGSGAQTSAFASDARLNEIGPANGQVSFNSQLATNIANPVSAQDAATKAYVDSVAAGLDAKQSVRVATTGAITLSGTQTIDGVAVVVGDRVLVKNNATDNHIYIVAASAWTIAPEADTIAEETGAFTFVERGTQQGTGWVAKTSISDLSSTVWVQFSAANAYTGGNGLTLTGNDFAVNVDSVGIEISADALRLKDSGVTSAKIADGTIVDGDVAAANKDGVAGTASMRTLGAGAQQAAAGNHNHSGTYEPVITTLPIAKGGTGGNSALSARISLAVPYGVAVVMPALSAGVWTAVSGAPDPQTGIIAQFMESSSPYEQVWLDVRQGPSIGDLQVKADVAYSAGALYAQFALRTVA